MKKSLKFRTMAGILAWIIALGTVPSVVSSANEIEEDPPAEVIESVDADYLGEVDDETEPEGTELDVTEPEKEDSEGGSEDNSENTSVEGAPEDNSENTSVEGGSEDNSENTSGEGAPEDNSENTSGEGAPEDNSENTSGEGVPEDNSENTSGEGASEDNSEGTSEEEPQPEESSLYEQLLVSKTLTEMHRLLTAEENAETLVLLTEEEVTELIAKTNELYDAVSADNPMSEELVLSAEIINTLNALPNAPVPVMEEVLEDEFEENFEEEPAEEENFEEEPAEIIERNLEIKGLVKVSGWILEGVELVAELLDKTAETQDDVVVYDDYIFDSESENPILFSFRGNDTAVIFDEEPAEEDKAEYIFSVDITLYDENGEVWQPDEPVEVTLDAYTLGLNDGDEIRIWHEHEGEVNDLGVYAVEDGELTFEMDGFSVVSGEKVSTYADSDVGITIDPDANFIMVSKKFEGITKDQIPENFTITVAPESGKTYELTEENVLTISEDRLVWEWRIDNVGAGIYTVSESNAEIDNYILKIDGIGENDIVEIKAADLITNLIDGTSQGSGTVYPVYEGSIYISRE